MPDEVLVGSGAGTEMVAGTSWHRNVMAQELGDKGVVWREMVCQGNGLFGVGETTIRSWNMPAER